MSTNESVLLIDICMPPPQDSDDDCVTIADTVDSAPQEEDLSSFESPESDYNMTPFADILPAINSTVLPVKTKTKSVICLPSLAAAPPYSSRIRPRGESRRRSRDLGMLSPSLSRVLKEKYGGHGGKSSKLRTPRTLTRLMQQHRDSERHRHRGLNATIKEISRKIPGFEDATNETKIVKLQRIINYICHLEEHIVTLCEDQGLDLEFKNLFLLPHLPKVNDVKKNKRKVTTSMNTVESIDDIDEDEKIAVDSSTALKASNVRRIKISTASSSLNTIAELTLAPPAADDHDPAEAEAISALAWLENNGETTPDVRHGSHVQQTANQIIVNYGPDDHIEEVVHEGVAAFHSYAKTMPCHTALTDIIDKAAVCSGLLSEVDDSEANNLQQPVASPHVRNADLASEPNSCDSEFAQHHSQHEERGLEQVRDCSEQVRDGAEQVRSGSENVYHCVPHDSGESDETSMNQDDQVVPSAGEVATTTNEAISAVASIIKSCPTAHGETTPTSTATKNSRVDHRKSSWMNGFMMYSRLHRKMYIEEHPGVHTSYISKLMGHDWRHLPSAEQQPYRDKAKLYIKQYLSPHARSLDKAAQNNTS